MESQFHRVLSAEFEAARLKMGISAALYQNGRLWTEAIGWANESTPMTTSTPLAVKSSSKTFLAALVLSQVEDGLYGLEDRVSTLLAGHRGYESLDPTFVPDATVEQLLTQTSGVQEDVLTGMKAFMVMMSPKWEPANNFSLIREPASPSGTYRYAGPNSYLLGMIAEHLGGNTLNSLYQEELLAPLSIQAGLLPTIETPHNMASPHEDLSQYGGAPVFGDLTSIPFFSRVGFIEADSRVAWAAAGMVSTPENMARWAYELFSPNGSAVSPRVRAQLNSSFLPETISLSAAPQKYGFHVALKGHRLADGTQILTIGHPGGGAGYGSALFYAPSMDLAISILTNSDFGFLPGTCATYSEHWLNPFDCITRGFFEAVAGQ